MLPQCLKLQLLRATVFSSKFGPVLRTVSYDQGTIKFQSPQNCARLLSVKSSRNFSVDNTSYNRYFTTSKTLTPVEFDQTCEETLDSLVEYFEELSEAVPEFKNADITYSDGVVTAFLGDSFGTYVINRQTPNQQIWLSSPSSGPKRYDFVGGTWIYKHDNTSLHTLLEREISSLIKQPVEFCSRCSFGKKS